MAAVRPDVAEAIARAFHQTYERLAPVHAYRTRKASAVPWEDVPGNNRALMIATVGALLDDGVISPAAADAAVPDGADVDQVAAAAYAAYGESAGGLNVRGEQLPDWDGLGPEIRNAWRAAIERVLTLIAPDDQTT